MIIDKIALALLIIGGLNWGSVGLFQFDLVAFACGGSASMISRIIYTIVDLSAVPGYVGQEKLTRGRGGTFLLEGRLGSRIPAVLFYMS